MFCRWQRSKAHGLPRARILIGRHELAETFVAKHKRNRHCPQNQAPEERQLLEAAREISIGSESCRYEGNLMADFVTLIAPCEPTHGRLVPLPASTFVLRFVFPVRRDVSATGCLVACVGQKRRICLQASDSPNSTYGMIIRKMCYQISPKHRHTCKKHVFVF